MSKKFFPIKRKFARTFSDHLARYIFAMEPCYRRSVMDAGCQVGYGGQILSYVANSVSFVDINETYIKIAQNQSYMCPTDFHVADLNKELPEGKWGAITAFETIEHLEEPEIFLENVYDRLEDGGKFVFSVPHMVANHEHKRLYDIRDTVELISKNLYIEELYTQNFKPISHKPMHKGLSCHVGIAVKK